MIGRLILGAVAAAGVMLATSCHHSPKPVQQAEQRAAEATVDAHLSRAIAAAADRAAERVAHSRAATDEATDAVQAAPSAADPIPEDVRSAWLAGIERVRQQSDAGAAGVDPAQPHPAVPAS